MDHAVVDADSCDAVSWTAGSFTGLPAAGCQDFTIAEDDFLQLACSNAAGHRVVGKWARIAPAVTSFAATPAQVFLDEGPTTTLSWESTGFATCQLVLPDGSRSSVPVDGTSEVTLPAGVAGAIYALDCLDSTGVARWFEVAVDVFPER